MSLNGVLRLARRAMGTADVISGGRTQLWLAGGGSDLDKQRFSLDVPLKQQRISILGHNLPCLHGVLRGMV